MPVIRQAVILATNPVREFQGAKGGSVNIRAFRRLECQEGDGAFWIAVDGQTIAGAGSVHVCDEGVGGWGASAARLKVLLSRMKKPDGQLDL